MDEKEKALAEVFAVAPIIEEAGQRSVVVRYSLESSPETFGDSGWSITVEGGATLSVRVDESDVPRYVADRLLVGGVGRASKP
jgi:hypothetical protein